MHHNDKNIIEQIIDQVNDLIENIATSASDALDQAEPSVLDRQSMPPSEIPSTDAIESPAFSETNDKRLIEPAKRPT